jgi:hypothetical protein
MGIFGFFSRGEKKDGAARPGSARYIYRPYENAMSWRVEFRQGEGYVYSGWSKSFLFKIEEGKIYSAADELAYLINGNKIENAAADKTLYIIRGNEVFAAGGREAEYVIKNSITVQGTL